MQARSLGVMHLAHHLLTRVPPMLVPSGGVPTPPTCQRAWSPYASASPWRSCRCRNLARTPRSRADARGRRWTAAPPARVVRAAPSSSQRAPARDAAPGQLPRRLPARWHGCHLCPQLGGSVRRQLAQVLQPEAAPRLAGAGQQARRHLNFAPLPVRTGWASCTRPIGCRMYIL